MPDEVCVRNRQLGNAAFNVPERRPYLIQTHSSLVAEVRKFIAIIAAKIAIFRNFEHKLGRRVDSHRHASRHDKGTRSVALPSGQIPAENLLSMISFPDSRFPSEALAMAANQS